jgi:hypothetical protein
MKIYKRKFESQEAAFDYLNERGKLKYIGHSGGAEFMVFNFHHVSSGRKYHIDVFPDGLIRVEEFNAATYDHFRNE